MKGLNELSKEALRVAEKRIANGSAMTEDNLKHASEEVVEAVSARENYKHEKNLSNYTYVRESDLLADKFDFADDLMDVIVCVLIECAKYNIDVEESLTRCMEKNRKRAEGIGDKL